ncbi:MAG: hypothetical protein M3373_07090 [Gemmatimonadota bacterium]|nr:hypothetical protein [Gemmatimonadota bacterium]
MSRTQPGIIFTINDSGNDPILFALDTTGADRGAWLVVGAANRDWEAVSVGPCFATGGSGGVERGVPRCLYIGDIGDNYARRPSRTIYRIAEPAARHTGYTAEARAESVIYVYSEGPRDVEAMYVGPNATIYLITKRPLKDASGRLRPALVFTLPPRAWRRGDSVAVVRLSDSIPLIPGSAPGRMITDAALSPDGRYVAVRTYTQVYVFAADSITGRIRVSVPPSTCNIAGLRERQGEGITWYGATGKLLLTSEGRREPMWVVACPVPGR